MLRQLFSLSSKVNPLNLRLRSIKSNACRYVQGRVSYNEYGGVLLPARSQTAGVVSRKVVGYWLLGCSGMVSVAVLLGGVTRLTESGLSMVTWNLLGERKPRNRAEWEAEFEKYKQFPEFKMLNSSMTLKEFQFIYYMEYTHRMWGRAIGAVFLIPATLLWMRGYLNGALKRRVLLAGALIGGQGLMGWYMVKSGLEDRFNGVNDIPRVSQYRLASHLLLAFLLHTLCLSTALSCLLPAERTTTHMTRNAVKFRRLLRSTMGLIFVTALSGAFVAGLDAGLIYNSFPKMADEWIPADIFTQKPLWRNFSENPTTVQFSHRLLGITTFTLISTLYLLSRRTVLSRRAHWATNTLMVLASMQVTLGIVTLLNHVPVPLAASHQFGSLMLLSVVTWLNNELKHLKYIPK